MLDVKFYEAFEEEEKAIRRGMPSGISAEYTKDTIQESEDGQPTAKIVCIRNQSQLPIEWAGKMPAVLARSQGYDHLQKYIKETSYSGSCGYIGDYCSRAVAEHAVMAMFTLLRKFKKQQTQFSEFKRDGITGEECEGRNALIIGVGNIGSKIVQMTKALGMDVYGVDLAAKIKDLHYVPLNEGIRCAEIVFCALPLTEETQGMLGAEFFKNARKGTYFINISRGEISPIEQMKELLDKEILGGIALDVFCVEKELAVSLRGHSRNTNPKIETIKELEKRDDVVFTPHNAFNTKEALEKKAYRSIEAAVSFLDKGVFPYPVSL